MRRKLAGDLVMRQARDGEQMLALDGKTYALDPSIAVIADCQGVRGLGRHHGRRGHGRARGYHRGVSSKVAYFDAIRTAASGRKLGVLGRALSLRSAASIRNRAGGVPRWRRA